MLGEQWWWKAPKCIWQGVNIELKDKQGDCPSLFMPIETQGNVTQTQQPLSVGSCHIGKEQPGHSTSTPCLPLDSFVLDCLLYLYGIIASKSGRGNTCIFKIISFYCFCNSNSNDIAEGQRVPWAGHWAPSISIHTMETGIAGCPAFSG